MVNKISEALIYIKKIKADLNKIKVFLDDDIDAPKRQEWAQGYDIWVTTPEEAIELLKKGNVSHISLDHDLGLEPDNRNGYMVAKFIEEAAFNEELPSLTWRIHSQNPRGRQNMEAALRNADRFWSEREVNEKEES